MRAVPTALALLVSLPLLAPAVAQTPPVAPRPAAQAAAATATGYGVELVIFRITGSQGSPEDWTAAGASAPPVPGAADDTGGSADAAANGRFVRTMDGSELQLNDVVSRLRANGAYPLVAHVGWIQNATPWGRRQSLSLQQLGINVPGLAGSVILERGEFLHLGLALELAVANPPADLSAPPGTIFTLHDNHRVKLYERNYYDSPAFGVIALVTPPQRAAK